MVKHLVLVSTCFLMLTFVRSEVVCSEDELVKELKEDLEDNGKLDCLRESLPRNPKESASEKAKREAANWNGDCSFEAPGGGSNSWKTRLEKIYGLTKGLVDVDGNPVEGNFPDQADMCEIIRAMVANNLFPNIGNDVTNINPDLVQYIDCPGEDGQTEVCAANPRSFADRKGWYIFLDGQSISFNGKPKYEVSNQ